MRHSPLAIALPLALLACTGGEPANGQAAVSTEKPFDVATIADFDAPWAMTFLPDGVGDPLRRQRRSGRIDGRRTAPAICNE